MLPEILNNKPLVEAIFELRWELEQDDDENFIDPQYRFLISRFSDTLQDTYSHLEALPSAKLPDGMAAQIVQYRFRKEENTWPVIQIGPGILTVNSTTDYTWNSFKNHIAFAIRVLYGSYNSKHTNQSLSISSLVLRYRNAVEVDLEQENILHFLGSKMKLKIDIDNSFFEDTQIENVPALFNIALVYPSLEPKGVLHLNFNQGEREEKAVVLWQTIFESQEDDVPQSIEGIESWGNAAHQVIRKWFAHIISGELLERFK